jgi:hypothetical protein
MNTTSGHIFHSSRFMQRRLAGGSGRRTAVFADGIRTYARTIVVQQWIGVASGLQRGFGTVGCRGRLSSSEFSLGRHQVVIKQKTLRLFTVC